MFGLPMRSELDEETLFLAPYSKQEISEIWPYITFTTMEHMVHFAGQTAASEEAWYKTMIEDSAITSWGIRVGNSLTDSQLIGNTSLRKTDDCRYVSGIFIWRTEFWGKGIASKAHLARTLYAADNLKAIAIDSEVMVANVASARAIQKVGYVETGTNYHRVFRAGAVRHSANYLWINPRKHAWNFFWGGTAAPPEFRKAKPQALAALERAEREVSML